MCVCACMCACMSQYSQGLFSFSHYLICVLKTLSSVNVLISDGNMFHSLVPISAKDDCPNVVLYFDSLKFPLVAPLGLILLFCLFINWQSISGAGLLTHLKISFKNEKFTKLSKPSKLCFLENLAMMPSSRFLIHYFLIHWCHC